MTKKRVLKKLSYVALCFVAVAYLVPISWMVLASLDTNASLSFAMPENWTLQNYITVISKAENQTAIKNGLFLGFGTAILVVVCSCLAAYPLSRYEMRHKRLFLLTILFMTALPGTVLIIPVYKMFLVMNLFDNLLGVVLFMAAGGIPYAMWLMKNFMDSIPIELEEAAWVDGANTFQSLRYIILPLMLPGVFTVFIHSFSGAWGNFLTPFLLLISLDKMPLSVQIYQNFGSNTVNYGTLAAFSAIYTIPSVILYILAQKYMSKGFTMQGAAKG